MPCVRSGAVVKDEPKAHRRKAARSVLYFGVSVGHSDQDFAPSGAPFSYPSERYPQLRADSYRKSIGIYIGLRHKLHVDKSLNPQGVVDNASEAGTGRDAALAQSAGGTGKG